MKYLIAIPLFCCSCIQGGAEPAPTFTIWSGWNHTWDMLAHRVSLIRVKSNEDGTAESGILGGDWSTGATWSDAVLYRIHQQSVSSRTIDAHYGETVLPIGPEGTATALHALDDFDADVVVLSGFEITTDVEQEASYPPEYDPALGYTSRGFGMSVSLTDANEIHVDGSVRWGPRDRADMNEAIHHANSQLTIWWTALSGIDDFETLSVDGSQDLAHNPPNSTQAAITKDLHWESRGPGIAAISGFDLHLYDTDGGEGGDYLRSFGVEIEPMSDASPPNEMSGEILTSNAIELGKMSMDMAADMIWVPTTFATVQARAHGGIHNIGTHISGTNDVLAPADITGSNSDTNHVHQYPFGRAGQTLRYR